MRVGVDMLVRNLGYSRSEANELIVDIINELDKRTVDNLIRAATEKNRSLGSAWAEILAHPKYEKDQIQTLSEEYTDEDGVKVVPIGRIE